MARWADEQYERRLRDSPLPVYRVTAVHSITMEVAAHSPEAAKRIAETAATKGFIGSGIVQKSGVEARVVGVSLPMFGQYAEPAATPSPSRKERRRAAR
jgi:hypothetical protein